MIGSVICSPNVLLLDDESQISEGTAPLFFKLARAVGHHTVLRKPGWGAMTARTAIIR